MALMDLGSSKMPDRLVFSGGDLGNWRILDVCAVRGVGLAMAGFVNVSLLPTTGAKWSLAGVKSNLRYAVRGEVESLARRQEPLGRVAATRGALIPIKKTAAWWALAQDERRAIFEEQSQHTAIGMDYLPAIARQLFHARDLGEPFDFLTWFEYAPEDADRFEDLVVRLRETAEWGFVDREVDIRLERVEPTEE